MITNQNRKTNTTENETEWKHKYAYMRERERERERERTDHEEIECMLAHQNITVKLLERPAELNGGSTCLAKETRE